LYGTELKRVQLLGVFIKLTIGMDLDLDPSLGPLFGELFEVLGRATFRRMGCNDMAELDDDWLLRARAGVVKPAAMLTARINANNVFTKLLLNNLSLRTRPVLVCTKGSNTHVARDP